MLMQDNICFALLAFRGSLTRNRMLWNDVGIIDFSVERGVFEWSVAHLPWRYIQYYTKDGVAPLLPRPRL